MKKLKLDPVYLKQSLYVLAIILIAITYYRLVSSIDVVYTAALNVLNSISSILAPFFYGALIAFILNPLIRRLEIIIKKVKFINKHPKFARFISGITVFFCIIAGLIWMVATIIPNLAQSLTALYESIIGIIQDPNSDTSLEIINRINSLTRQNFVSFQEILNSELVAVAVESLQNMTGDLTGLAGQALSGTLSIGRMLLDIILGIIIAFYMILEKENLAKTSAKATKLFFKEKTAGSIIDIAKASNNMFEKFFTGKLLDSIIIAMIFYVVVEYFLKLEYSLFFSIIIGITNMIPYFGPFIGGIPVSVIVLLGDTRLGLWTGFTIFLLQQFDGNILGPLILGDSTGVKPLEVIFAIIVGGATFGVLGMFFGVPVYAVLKTIIVGFINRRYGEKAENETENAVVDSVEECQTSE